MQGPGKLFIPLKNYLILEGHYKYAFAPTWLNEFYKKGCQEKIPPRPEWRVFLKIQPTVVSLLGRGLAGCPFS
jgi:hypothetical protein